MDEKGLGKHLQAARVAAGLTQQELCQKADISYSTLAKIERGAIKAPSVFTIQRLSGVFGMSLDELLGSSSGGAKKTKGRSKNGVTFIYFDVNGCLVRFFHSAFTKLAHDSGAPADVIESVFWRYNDDVCRGEISLSDFNKLLAKELGMDSIDWQNYYMRAVSPIIEMHDLAAWAAKHYNIGLLSNIMPGFIDEMVAEGLLPNLAYTAIVDSSKVGAIKPEKHIYEIAGEMAGVPDEEIMLVDDSRTNLMAAGNLGWKVLWFDDFKPDESAVRVRQALELAD